MTDAGGSAISARLMNDLRRNPVPSGNRPLLGGSLNGYLNSNLLPCGAALMTLGCASLVHGADASLDRGREQRPNVLFLAVDDLRPELGSYGFDHMVTPNIDALAANGVRFERAYCMVPVCGASRATLMTGLRPGPGFMDHWTSRADRDAPDAVPLHAHFTAHGYRTVSLGKVFHYMDDHAAGWSEPPWRPSHPGVSYCDCYVLPESLETARRHREAAPRGPRQRHRGPPYEIADVPDEAYSDGMTNERAIEDLRRLAAGGEPFFLAVGYVRPHLPFLAPQRYWELYDPEMIALPENYKPPTDCPRQALHNWSELRAYAGVPQSGPLPDDLALRLIHGYYACVSYVDALIGRLLDELDVLGLADNTVVVLWGDHGWQLGEHGLWCKHSCFETSMRAPLIVRVPGGKTGLSVEALVEFIDIYPTLCDLTAIPRPEHLEGVSFEPMLYGHGMPAAKEHALGRYGRGETIRNDRYRYTEFVNNRGEIVARMLFDHDVDPRETVNVVASAEHREAVEELSRRLAANRVAPRDH